MATLKSLIDPINPQTIQEHLIKENILYWLLQSHIWDYEEEILYNLANQPQAPRELKIDIDDSPFTPDDVVYFITHYGLGVIDKLGRLQITLT